MLKDKLILPLFLLGLSAVLTAVAGLGIASGIPETVIPAKQIKPEKIENKIDSKVISVASSSTPLRIEEKILGSKVLLNQILTTTKGNELLVLVNKKIRLPSNYVPPDLVSLVGSVTAASGSSLRSEAAINLIDLVNAAETDGKNLSVVSAYRSYSQQVGVFNGWVASAGLKSAERFSARPGHSQHQLGTAVDFGVSGQSSFSEGFGITPEGVWLTQNAHEFGFVLSYPKGKEAITGYSYEPWHYRYIGKENAQKMIGAGLILEEFLQRFGTW
jgi:D-alanyl-D-alanine carboxypeptidase